MLISKIKFNESNSIIFFIQSDQLNATINNIQVYNDLLKQKVWIKRVLICIISNLKNKVLFSKNLLINENANLNKMLHQWRFLNNLIDYIIKNKKKRIRYFSQFLNKNKFLTIFLNKLILPRSSNSIKLL